MSFLAPLFLLGGLAIAAPILFHLIRRTSREKTIFSSLMFLQPTPPRVTRRSRLENIWLLLLRCLVLLLLTLGFARPFLQRPSAADSQAGNGRKLVVLLDASASMRRDSLWDDARARAGEILRQTTVADSVALFAFDTRLHPLVSFEQWSAMSAGERAPLALKRLAETKPGWASTHLGNSLLAAVETLEDAANREAQKHGHRQIILITDMQEGARLEGLQGYEWPRGLELSIETVKPKRPTNAGLQLVTDREDGAKPDTEAGPRLRVSNAAESKREQFQVAWTDAGARRGDAVEVYVPPGQSRIVAAPKPSPGLAPEHLVLTGDDQEFDNSLYVATPKTEQIKILYLGSETEHDSAQPLYFLKRAFPPTRRQTVEIVARPASAPLAAADADSALLLILTDPVTDERAVQKFLADGKIVLVAMKSPATAATIGHLAGAAGFTATESTDGGYAMLGQIDFEHPLFAPFADPRYSDFTKIHFWKHRRVAADQLPRARVLARFDKGDAALLQLTVGRGTLLVLTAAWHPADSQLALSSKFVPLLYAVLEQSGAIRSQLAQYVVGEEIALSVTNSAQIVKVRQPDGSEAESRAGGRFVRTEQPGIYIVAGAQPPVRFAVNLAPEESRTTPLAMEELQRLGLPLQRPAADQVKLAEQKRRLQNTDLEARQKLWRWLIVGALVVLLLESWLAGWLTKRGALEAKAAA